MDRDLLKHLIDQGMSLPQIGERVNRDPSTVGYWVQKYGLAANGRDKYAPRGGLTREQLEPLVERGATLQEIADELDRSMSTVRHWLDRHGLVLARKRQRRAEFEAADRAGLNRADAECPRHGMTEFIRRAGGWRCRRCRSDGVASWRRRAKLRLVEEAGGACRICGYNRYLGALQFHHLDPALKEFALNRRGVTRAFAELQAEARKCVLLCANCHAEVEGGVVSIP
jgi:transposase